MVSTTPKGGPFITARESQDPPTPADRWLTASDIEPEQVKWLWYPYVAFGKMTFLEGDPGLGKSWITAAMAAAVSNGRPLPGQHGTRSPQNVLMLSAEDGLADTIVPRLIAMGADLERVHFPREHFVLNAKGLLELEEGLAHYAATVIFVDPIQAYTGEKIDIHKANEVRSLMAPLKFLAERTGSAIVIVRHLRKAQGKAMYQGLGSIDFGAAVRSVIQVKESKSGRRFMTHIKTNLGPEGAALEYSLVDGRFSWEGEYEDEDVRAPSTTPKVNRAIREWLQETLRDGPRVASEVYGAAKERGWSPHQMRRAKEGVAYVRKEGMRWLWGLVASEGMGQGVQEGPVAPDPLDKYVKEAQEKLSAGANG